MLRTFILAVSFSGIISSGLAEPIERSLVFVKDGDTIIVTPDGHDLWAKDDEYRLVDFDTPETSRPQARCPAEIEKGHRAAARLIALLDSGELDLTEVRCSGHNRGRRCGQLTVDGVDVGKTLIAEGLAVPYHYARKRISTRKNHNWCADP